MHTTTEPAMTRIDQWALDDASTPVILLKKPRQEVNRMAKTTRRRTYPQYARISRMVLRGSTQRKHHQYQQTRLYCYD